MGLYHQRLGHSMLQTVKAIVVDFSLPVQNKKYEFCQSCHMNKSHKLPFSYWSTIYNSPLDLIVSDIWGPTPVTFNNGFRCYVIFLDVSVVTFGCFQLQKNLMLLVFLSHSKIKLSASLNAK